MSESAKTTGEADLEENAEEPNVAVELAGAPEDDTEANQQVSASTQGVLDRSGEDEVERLQQERDRYYEGLLRQAAEFENYRKRVERERREQAEFAAADVLRGLLPLVDGMERALAAPAPPAAASYRKGVELIHRQMLDLLRKHGVTPIEAVGQSFDPRLHEAVIHEPSDAHEDGEVIEELQRGYRLGDRLLRPAMVKVAKA